MNNENLESLIAKPCSFTFVTGPKIGQRCGQLTNGYRCIVHAGQGWGNLPSRACKRLLTKGGRVGQSCGKSTKFEDGVCSTCRKMSVPSSGEQKRLYKRDFKLGDMVTDGAFQGTIIEMLQQKAIILSDSKYNPNDALDRFENHSIWYGALRKC
jgi:hypothetical protein